MATIYATGFWDMLIYRALTGIGEGMQMAALYVIIGSYFYKDKALAIGGMIALFIAMKPEVFAGLIQM